MFTPSFRVSKKCVSVNERYVTGATETEDIWWHLLWHAHVWGIDMGYIFFLKFNKCGIMVTKHGSLLGLQEELTTAYWMISTLLWIITDRSRSLANGILKEKDLM